MKLTPKQELFVHEYLKDFNGTRAAIAAGYNEKSAKAIASENLTKPYLQEAITKAQKERVEEVKVDANWVLRRLVDEIEADIADLYTEEGSLKPVHQWPKIWRTGLISGIDVQQQFINVDGEQVSDGIVTKIKQSDRHKRTELLGRHVNIQAFKDKVEVDQNVTFDMDYGAEKD